jgi:hypothetical protein
MPISHRGLRPGTPAYALVREAVLRRHAGSALIAASHARTPEEHRRAQRQMAAAQHELREIAARREFRNRLRRRDRDMFDALSLKKQDQLRKMLRDHPGGLSPDTFQ